MAFDGQERFSGTDRFEVLSRLGVGGSGVVYEVYDRERSTRVALKKLRALHPEALRHFKSEFRVLENLHHPNLVVLGELIEDGGDWFFTMELVDGVDFLRYVRPHDDPGGTLELDSTVRFAAGSGEDTAPPAPPVVPPATDEGLSDPGFDERRLRQAMGQLASAVAALHDAGKVHRDIKPSNIRVSDAGRVVLLDLGLAIDIARDTLPALDVAGTAAYMAPEQAASGPVGPAADWYSVGVLLYQALTGRLPFAGAPLEVMLTKQRAEPPSPLRLVRAVPPDLTQLCMRLLRPAPSDRPSGREILAALRPEAPEPGGVSAPVSALFVGRDAELARLRELHGQAPAGLTVLVEGESGVGKTALVRRFTDELGLARPGEGARLRLVLSGRCHERESVAFKAFDDIIDGLATVLGGLPREDAARALPRGAALVAQAFPVLQRVEAIADTPPPPSAPAEKLERRALVFAAIRELFERLAARWQLVLVIDDLQWADADSLALLETILRPPDAPRFFLLATVRTAGAPSEGTDERPLIDLPGRVERLQLAGLSARDADELTRLLIEQVAGKAAPPSAGAIAHEASGHPLFIGELVRYSAAHPGASLSSLRLEQALWKRVLSLDHYSRRLLEITAVAGAPLRQDVAARAAEAADLADFDRWLSVLRTAQLVRTTGVRGLDTIEPYHDRVRAAILTQIPAEARAICHRRLAVALERAGDADPEALAVHWQGAGDPRPAARYAREAARGAAEAFAFERAARLYRLALDLWAPEGPERTGLLSELGDALANAGRGPDAADIYCAAAEGARPEEALELRRRAAEQYLRSGHNEAGLRVLETVLGGIGMKLAKTPRRALASLLFTRARLRLRGVGFRAREPAPSELIRVDACWAVAAGLAMADAIRGADFQARHLLLALESGDPYRVCRGLAMEVCFQATAANDARCRLLHDRAAALAETVDDPRARGIVALAGGVNAYLFGRWREAREACAAAEALIRDQCTGMSWELFNARYYGLLTYAWSGELAEFSRRLPVLRRDSDERGDRFGSTLLRNGITAILPLAADDPTLAREQARRVTHGYVGASLQVYWETLAHALSYLYEGDGAAALRTLDDSWSELRRAMTLRVQYLRIEAIWTRARAALATARGGGRADLIRMARRAARQLGGEGAPWAVPMGLAVSAGVAELGGRDEEAAALLADAAARFDACDMLLFAAAARRRRGAIIGGDEGATLVADAEAWIRGQNVTDPARMAAVFIPDL